MRDWKTVATLVVATCWMEKGSKKYKENRYKKKKIVRPTTGAKGFLLGLLYCQAQFQLAIAVAIEMS